MAIEFWCRTDVGRKRESNQDSYLLNQDLGLFIVADGMGGHSGGEVASLLAVKTVEDIIKNPPLADMKPRDLLSYAYSEASRRIYDKAAYEQPELVGMGTTMVVIYHNNSSLFIGNVGDSRCYLYRKPNLWQVTEDHSLVNEQVRAGLLKEDQAKNFSAKNVITRSVGYERDVIADILERPLVKGDTFLLCSDGLSGLVTDEKITEIFTKNANSNIVEKLIEEALKNGGDDNVTALIVAVQ